MFDSVGAFARQFTAVEGGYLYYPARKRGGKLVTAEEYEGLVADFRRVAGTSGLLKTAGVVILFAMLWTLLAQTLLLAEWAKALGLPAIVAGVCAYLFRASFAPYRLVKGRPDATPPRPASDARRQARAALNWPLVTVALLVSGAVFIGSATAPERTLSTWAWLVGSGLMFVAYLWLALLKLRDGRG
jgi:hypothetical protein